MATFIKNNCDCCPPSVCEPCGPGDPCAATSGTGGYGTLYYKNGNYLLDAWEDVNNWWQDAAATIPALGAPWIQPCFAYRNYNLTIATDQPPDNYRTVSISPDPWMYGITTVSGYGTCDIPNILLDQGVIEDGTFTGDSFWNGFGNIRGGTFTGDTFWNDENISGGTFSGSDFVNSGTIDGGLFLNSGFTNFWTNAGYFRLGHISGGTWAGSGFVNDDGSGNAGYVCAPSWPVQTC